MTVIILARATDGFVVTSDGRTCTNDLPKDIYDDCAVKVRVHRFGPGGYITASSGRARIGSAPIADVEARYVAQLKDTHEIPSPKAFAEYLRTAIKEYNLKQSCDCATRIDKCVYENTPCLDCIDTPDPHCDECRGEHRYVWAKNGPASNGDCMCSPGEGEPSTKSPKYPWCRCTTHVEGDLQWLCVPFGPERTDPVTTTITCDHEAQFDLHAITRYPVVQGELATKRDYMIPVICETSRHAARFDTDGTDGNVVGIDETIERVRSLLATAYEEGKHHAALRLGYPSPSEIGLGDKTEVTIKELAKALRGLDSNLDEKVGVSGIGGRALVAIGEDNGHARDPQPLPIPRLGDEECVELSQ
ncbi:hypothetical protein [Rhodococcus sp. DMU1]|uniref:hypothetical protein n=1 Tax=Rhodococcus sp. DMU1 TaxID=2722825 RepID=UPI00143E3C57|nr:hypothetical protein [Rhodococcus sp. DMU1]QIX54002.1 hypothetical protein HFP48_31245 [Rhodococcus sp. DMU1]